MALSWRQQKAYVHVVDLYKPKDLSVNQINMPRDVIYPETPTLPGVKCYRETRIEVTVTEPVGRTNRDNYFTVDMFHFEYSVPIAGNWAVKFSVPGHPDDGQWFVALGETQVKNWKANKHSLLCKRINKPAGVA